MLRWSALAAALGLFDDLSAGPCPSLQVDRGDCLVCFTDGVIDRPDPDGELYGLDRLDAYRWLERVTYHGWRILHHLPRVHLGAPPDAPSRDIPPHAEPEQQE